MTKINLLYGQGDYMSGHINIDPLNATGDKIVKGDWKNLDEWVEDAEATTILALHGVVEYIPRPEIDSVIDHWVKKLRHGGTLVVNFMDCYEIAKEFVAFNTPLTEFNQFLHGNQGREELVKTCSFTTHGFAEYLTVKHGLEIITKRINGFDATVEARRP